MTGPRRNHAWKATTHARQMNAWRLDAVKWRETAHQRELRLRAVNSLVARALSLLNDDDPANARLHLIDALSFLTTDDTTQEGKPA